MVSKCLTNVEKHKHDHFCTPTELRLYTRILCQMPSHANTSISFRHRRLVGVARFVESPVTAPLEAAARVPGNFDPKCSASSWRASVKMYHLSLRLLNKAFPQGMGGSTSAWSRVSSIAPTRKRSSTTVILSWAAASPKSSTHCHAISSNVLSAKCHILANVHRSSRGCPR